jgi:RNA polymerase primary sigma factor
MLPDAEFDERLFERAVEQVGAAGIVFKEEEETDEPVLEDFNQLSESLEELVEVLPPGEDILAGIEVDNMLRMYFREAASTPLLTPDQELELARWVDACRRAQAELNQGVASERRRSELESVIQRGQQARDRMIQANARLVISVARRYQNYGMPLLDLIQEGNIGLMRAVREFDYRRGFRFSTYATYWIRQHILRTLAEQSRLVRLPSYLNDRILHMKRESERLQQQLGRPPTDAELGQALNISPERVQELRRVSRGTVSLETPVGDDEESALGDVLPDPGSVSPEESTIQSMDAAEVRRRLEDLPARERELLELRFGLSGDEPMSLAEIGQRMGVSRERARQLEVQALGRLRNPEAKRRRAESTGKPELRPRVKKHGGV